MTPNPAERRDGDEVAVPDTVFVARGLTKVYEMGEVAFHDHRLTGADESEDVEDEVRVQT